MNARVDADLLASEGTELQAIAGFAQVNLLEAVAVAGRGGLPWWAPVACLGLVASVALGSGLQLNPLVAEQKQRAVEREAQVLAQTQLIEAAERQNKTGTAQDQARALQAALVQQERLLAMLGGGNAATAATTATGSPPTAQDFSALLEGLSRTRVDGLWLTQVRLDRRTQEVRLEGQTRNPQLVSTYIDDLSRNPRFKGLVLSAVEVSRPAARAAVPAEATEPARFKLASAAGGTATSTPTTPGKAGATP